MADALQLENGVWLARSKDSENDCPVNTAQPVSTWKSCAEWTYFRDGQWFEKERESGIEIKPFAGSILMTGGDPAMVQIELYEGDAVDPAQRSSPSSPRYVFAAFDGMPADRTSKLRLINYWIVKCGTHSPAEASTIDTATSSLERFAGFNQECQPASAKVLRAAATASRPSESDMSRLEWVRANLD
ncbi:MAG: hypothetical protein ABIT16_13085 [Croceibacterium sp.]